MTSSTLASPTSSRPAGKSIPITDIEASQSGQIVALTASVGSQVRWAHAPQPRQMRSNIIPFWARPCVESPPRSTSHTTAASRGTLQLESGAEATPPARRHLAVVIDRLGSHEVREPGYRFSRGAGHLQIVAARLDANAPDR